VVFEILPEKKIRGEQAKLLYASVSISNLPEEKKEKCK
jgi:hypothetical protein